MPPPSQPPPPPNVSSEDLKTGIALASFVMYDRTAAIEALRVSIPFIETHVHAGKLRTNSSGGSVVSLQDLASAHVARLSVCAVVRRDCVCVGETSSCSCRDVRDDDRTTLVRANTARLLDAGVIEADLSDVTVHSVRLVAAVTGTLVSVGLTPVLLPPVGGSSDVRRPLLPPRAPLLGRADGTTALVLLLPSGGGECRSAPLPETLTDDAIDTIVATRRGRTKAGATTAGMTPIARGEWAPLARNVIDFASGLKTTKEPQRFIIAKEAVFWRVVYDPTYKPAFSCVMNFREGGHEIPYRDADYAKQVALTGEALAVYEAVLKGLNTLLPYCNATGGLEVDLAVNAPGGGGSAEPGSVVVHMELAIGIGGVRLSAAAETFRVQLAAVEAQGSAEGALKVAKDAGAAAVAVATAAAGGGGGKHFQFTFSGSVLYVDMSLSVTTLWEDIFVTLRATNARAFERLPPDSTARWTVRPELDTCKYGGKTKYTEAHGAKFYLFVM